MRKILASLDIGSDTIKLIVGEIQKNKLNVLACVETPSRGIKKGYIVNLESASLALKDVFSKAENIIGLPISKVLVGVPSYNLECFKTQGSITIKSEDKVITHDDIIKAMQVGVYKQIESNRELVSLLPTKFMINDEESVKSPVNMIANKLTVQSVAVTIAKANVQNIMKCLESLGIKVIDICVSPLADYYEYKNGDINKMTGAIINIGQSTTTVSIFSKGILRCTEVIDIGSETIDNDLAYVFKINKNDARFIKENLAVMDIHAALPEEAVTINDINDSPKKINQYDASAVVISRLNEIMSLAKKQINLLTKKEISYIIVSGGISEIGYFDRFMEMSLGDKGILGNVEDIGARSNKYSVALGMLKYYNSRLKLRNAEFSIFTLDEQEDLGGMHKRININENSLLGKIYGYFFDN